VAGKARRGSAGLGVARRVAVWQAGRGRVRRGRARRGRRGMARRAMAGRGEARQARLGRARLGAARPGGAGEERHGAVRLDAVRQGRQGFSMIDFHPTPLLCYRCSASAWERIENVGREDVVECCFCGVLERVEAAAVPVRREASTGTAEFRFQYGRFKGLTLAEADREENGRAYLEHLRDTSDKLRDRIAEYLTTA